MLLDSFYKGKKVLVSGDTGFKGSWLVSWLEMLGAEVYGFGLEPDTVPSLFKILNLENRIKHTVLDIRNADKLRMYIKEIKPDVVFHLAAQPLVRLSYHIPLETLDTNVMGTANLLHAIGKICYTTESPCAVVVITSDKCYENRETYSAYREEDQMGGHDIYSASKGMVELLVSSWRHSFFSSSYSSASAIFMASCRAGNVIGGGDWATDRIIPDSIKSLIRNEPIQTRNPGSIRPWQHVQEPLSGYLQTGALLGASGGDKKSYCTTAWNFGPGRESERTVAELCDETIRHWGSGSWEHIASRENPHEAKFLKLSIDKAWHYLGWQPVWDFEKTMQQTVSWYRLANECNNDTDTMIKQTNAQIKQYVNDARLKSLRWAETSQER